MKKTVFCFILITLLASTVLAQDRGSVPILEPLLEKMVTSEGADYLEARDLVIKHAETYLPRLREKAAPENWTRENWKTAHAAAVCLGWIENKKDFEKCYSLENMRYERYKLKRRPIPDALEQFRNMGVDILPALIEIYEKTLQDYSFTTAEEAPKAEPDELKSLVEAEKEALLRGIFIALGSFKDQRAHHFLVEKLGKNEPLDARILAAKALGMLKNDKAARELVNVMQDKNAPEELVSAAVEGLGVCGGDKALEALASLAEGNMTESVKRALARALGEAGSLWKWKKRGALEDDAAQKARQTAEAALFKTLDSSQDLETVEVALLALVKVCMESSEKKIQERIKDSREERRELLRKYLDVLVTRINREKRTPR